MKDQITGRCVTAAISNSSFDVAEDATFINQSHMAYAIHMKNPMSLFYLDSNYTYTGRVQYLVYPAHILRGI